MSSEEDNALKKLNTFRKYYSYKRSEDYFIRWRDRQYFETEEPIVVDFDGKEAEVLQGRFPTMSLTQPLDCSLPYSYPVKRVEYESNFGDFQFLLDGEGNVIINYFFPKNAYVKLPSKIYDPDGRCYPIKRIETMHCKNLLKGLWIPEGIEILSCSFYYSKSLLDVYFPKSLTFFEAVFRTHPQFEDYEEGRIWYPGSQEEWYELVDSYNMRGLILGYIPYEETVRFYDPVRDIRIPDIEVITEKGKKEKLGEIRVCNQEGNVVIPETLEEQPEITITRIGMGSFANNESLTQITIPPTIQSIGENAFYGCKSLEKVVVMAGTDDLTIEEGAFSNCPKLKTVEFGRNVIVKDPCFDVG